MNKKNKIFMIVGIACILIGGFLKFNSSSVSAEQTAQCEIVVKERFKESADAFLGKCVDDPGFVAMMNTNEGAGAKEMAKSISKANKGSLLSSSISMFLLAFGMVLVIIPLVQTAMKKKESN